MARSNDYLIFSTASNALSEAFRLSRECGFLLTGLRIMPYFRRVGKFPFYRIYVFRLFIFKGVFLFVPIFLDFFMTLLKSPGSKFFQPGQPLRLDSVR